uniref:Uncharacterized protein n=1 Tax=Cacopsylla melanoneura TaxID=428564 RepID=A0A8D9BLH7_9HEMI
MSVNAKLYSFPLFIFSSDFRISNPPETKTFFSLYLGSRYYHHICSSSSIQSSTFCSHIRLILHPSICLLILLLLPIFLPSFFSDGLSALTTPSFFLSSLSF